MSSRHGREFLHRLLARLDHVAASRIQPLDTQKVIRAIEVCVLARQPISEMHAMGREGLEGYHTIKIGLDPPRGHLYDRINRRVEEMFRDGLVEETGGFLRDPTAERIKPLGALGYRQSRDFLQRKSSRQEAVASTQVDTRHYAKRQLTWFRREEDVVWFEGFGDDPQIQRRVLEVLGQMAVTREAGGNASSSAASVL
jgi:tRNA dimethylallyltransferase